MQAIEAAQQQVAGKPEQPALSDVEKLRGSSVRTAETQTADSDAPSSAALNLLIAMLWEASLCLCLRLGFMSGRDARIQGQV